MFRKAWLVAIIIIIIATVGASVVFGHFSWFKLNEHVALWLEGIALILIFVWDRIDNHRQHRESLAQLEASLEQVEAGHKPFVAFSTAPRDAGDAVLDMGGAVGGMIVRCPGGNVEIGNIGYGPAINVRYRTTHNIVDATEGGPSGYLADMV